MIRNKIYAAVDADVATQMLADCLDAVADALSSAACMFFKNDECKNSSIFYAFFVKIALFF